MGQSGTNGTRGELQKGEKKKQNVDHSQASVSTVRIQRGHKVDCPARICIKEAFILEGYQHVNL